MRKVDKPGSSMFKFIHAADVHLDSPLKGLEQYEGAPVKAIQDAARRALENLVRLAIDESVAFVMIAGDIYDGDWRDYNTGLFFIKQAARLRETGIPLYIIAGNHDAANRITRSLRLPDNVTLFPAEAPETAVVKELDVAIHGQSFATAAVYDDLSQSYPAARPGMLNIGLLHTCATGREGHDRYAPCTLEGLRLKGYDYWALGHIHARELLSDQPLIAFPGNVQGRHVRETGAKGCLLVTVNDDRSLQTTFRALDVLRWERLVVDASDARGVDDVLDSLGQRLKQQCGQAAGRPLAVRIELEGVSAAHRARYLPESTIGPTRFVHWRSTRAREKSGWKRSSSRRPPPRKTDQGPVLDGAIGELTAQFAAARSDPTNLSQVNFDLSDVLKKLPSELKDADRVTDPDWLRSVLAEAESRLLSQLLASEDDG